MLHLPLSNRNIEEPVENILETLLSVLQVRGIDYLRVLKRNKDNVQTCCPYHNEGKEKRPSSGITTIHTKKNPAGTFHCFVCGVVTSLPELISHCFGYSDKGKYGEKWLLENFVSGGMESRVSILENALVSLNQDIIPQTYITEEELQKYRYTHPYMYQRKLTDEIIELFDVGYDRETNCITFPCNDINGNCLFITRRNVNTKFFQMPEKIDKIVYGLDKIDFKTVKVLYVCESIINALTLWVWGMPAVALLGTGANDQYEQLKRLPIRKYILAFDGDNGGRLGTTRFIKHVKNKLIEYYIFPEGKDVNDLTYEQFIKLDKKGI